MAVPPTRRTLGEVLGRSVGVAATGIATAIERSTNVSPATTTVSNNGKVIDITAEVTPGTGLSPGYGAPLPVPDGSWAVLVSATGDWDYIWAGVIIGDGDPGATWVGHRPAPDPEDPDVPVGDAAGSYVFGEVSGPLVLTPVARVRGAGGDDVTVTVRLTRSGGGS